MQLPVVVFVIAIAASLLARATARLRPLVPRERARRRPLCRIKVLFAVPIRKEWREVLWHMISRARHPRRVFFCALLECTAPEDAELGDVDSELRSVARVEHVRAPPSEDPAHRLRRLHRRFVGGDEAVLVFVDPRARVVDGWDDAVAALVHRSAPGTVISAPAPSTRAPAFPTLRVRSTGSIARSTARAFAGTPTYACVPSVCWCSELTFGRPDAFQSWPLPLARHSAAAQTTRTPPHAVPACPLLEVDDALSEALLDDDEGADGMRCGPHERVGLTGDADDAERILKFGSSRAARLAVEFA